MPTELSDSSLTRRAAVVYNPIKVDIERLRAAVAAQEAEGGWADTLWLETSKEDAGQGVGAEAVAAGVDLIVAAGGDGTVRAVAESMHDSSASLGLLPSGTGNLLARNLKLTLDDLEDAVRVAFRGEDRAIDLGMIDIRDANARVTKHAYVVMAGLGLDAKMLAGTDDELKKTVGWLAYVKAVADALKDGNELRFRYSLDGASQRSMHAHTLIVGNCGSLPANIVLLPDAAIDDGEFDILLLRPQSVLGWVQIFAKVLWENGIVRRMPLADKIPLTEVQSLRYVRAKTLSVTLESPQEIELDGDAFGTATGLKTWVKPGGLTVRVPGEEERASLAAALLASAPKNVEELQNAAVSAMQDARHHLVRNQRIIGIGAAVAGLAALTITLVRRRR